LVSGRLSTKKEDKRLSKVDKPEVKDDLRREEQKPQSYSKVLEDKENAENIQPKPNTTTKSETVEQDIKPTKPKPKSKDATNNNQRGVSRRYLLEVQEEERRGILDVDGSGSDDPDYIPSLSSKSKPKPKQNAKNTGSKYINAVSKPKSGVLAQSGTEESRYQGKDTSAALRAQLNTVSKSGAEKVKEGGNNRVEAGVGTLSVSELVRSFSSMNVNKTSTENQKVFAEESDSEVEETFKKGNDSTVFGRDGVSKLSPSSTKTPLSSKIKNISEDAATELKTPPLERLATPASVKIERMQDPMLLTPVKNAIARRYCTKLN
jgi:hypothetical protein